MSAPLTAEAQAAYTKIIDNILAEADLQTVTRKLIRQGLQDAVQKDLSAHKDAIKSLIEQRFDAISTETQMPTPPEPRPASPRGQKAHGHRPRSASDVDEASASDDNDGEINVSLPPAKKQKREKSSSAEEDADARLAAELQAQENRLAKGRTTRGGTGGGSGKKAKVKADAGGNKRKSKSKSKSEKKVRDSEDSDVEGGGGVAKEKRKAGGGFAKPFALSPALQGLVGDAQMSRPQVVKKIWEYIKANDLQDPNDKREIICDDKMQAVFKTTKVNMFKMNKHLGNHLHEPEVEA
ncbi:hypothetical protein P8C59_003601 [Phyllachora maydis]|uniref:DM2 domain-containing protein n=1 Tax=Phyllachora maydis TaxID=1825666 RepID=A0AAD9I0Q2_9PEZI|nr:hypothetical protein P8C59_003601 [Phyllachora maydis]